MIKFQVCIRWGGGPEKVNETSPKWTFKRIFTSDDLTSDDLSRAIKVVRSSYLDRIEAENKLYPMQAATDQNLLFLGLV